MAVIAESKMEIIEKKNKQWPQWITTIIASLGFFTAGICFLWSSPSLAILRSDNTPLPITNSEASWIAAFLPIGCGVGPLIGSWSARHIGPKTTTMISSIPFIMGFGLIMIAQSPEWLYASRFLSGFAVGFGQSASPIYIAEISESKNRGSLSSFITFNMGTGALFMTILGPFFPLFTMALISMTFPLMLLLLTTFLPESPYFLMRTGKQEQSLKALMWFRHQKNESAVKEEFEEIKQLACQNMGLRDSLQLFMCDHNLKKIGIISLGFIGQSFCGAIVVMFFQEELYRKAHTPIPAEIAVIITAAISNISGFLSLLFVDKWGRKPLLLISTLGCALSTMAVGMYLYMDQINVLEGLAYINWLPIIALNMLQIFFYFGLNTIPTIQLGEIFCSNVKEIGFCLGFMMAATSGFIIAKFYQIIEDTYGLAVVFWSLSSITMIIFILMLWMIPETKGKTFAEIQNSFFVKKESMQELTTLSTCDSYVVNIKTTNNSPL